LGISYNKQASGGGTENREPHSEKGNTSGRCKPGNKGTNNGSHCLSISIADLENQSLDKIYKEFEHDEHTSLLHSQNCF